MVKYSLYGDTAIKAVQLLKDDKSKSPQAAWNKAVKTFSPSISSQKKGCPRGAFLGLCEEGYVKGVPVGNYTNSTKNKSYAIEAIRLLKSKPELANKKPELWIKACKDKKKKHNSQMDVVLALWEKYL